MKAMGKQQVEKTIQRIVRRIVMQFDPERIILFGSYARGEAGPDSDLDLLVVMPVYGSKREKELEIGVDRKSTRLNSSHSRASRMPSSA